MNTVVETLNMAGRAFIEFALPMLIQSGVLILILLAVDILLRRRVRAVFRYWIWMLVLVKLVLPPSLGSPVSVGTWFGDTLEAPAASLLESESPRAAEPHATKLGEARGIGILPMDHGLEAHATPVLVPPVATSLPGAPDEIEPSVLPETSATAPPAATLDWQGLLLLIWAVVVLALMLLLVQRAFFVRGLIDQSDQASRSMLDELEECRRRLGLRRRVALRLSPNATSPAVCGLLRPVILIPQALAPRLRTHDLRAVLLHELAHVKRGDLWINLAQTLLQIAYFYNPLLWLANAMIRRTREQAVDETVLVAMGESASQYPETLVNIAKLAFTRRPALSLRLIGVVESRSALTARIKHILARPLPKTARLGIFGAFLVLVVAVVLLPMAKARPLAGPGLDVVSPAAGEGRTFVEAPVAPDFVARLPGGATVEFLGIHDCAGGDESWWRPDGEALPGAPSGYSTNTRSHRPNEIYEVLFRISSPAGRTFAKMEWTRGTSSTPGFLYRNRGRRGSDVPDNADDLFNAVLTAGSEASRVRIDIAVGLENAWEPLGALNVQATQAAVTLSDAVIYPAREEGGKTLVTVTHRISDREVRLVAVDRNGSVHEPVGQATRQGGGIVSQEPRFELPLAEIRQFRLEAQKLTWMAFRNISLRPGQKTEVWTVLPDGDRESPGRAEPVAPPTGSPSDVTRTTAAVARLPNGVRVELIGIHDRAGGEESWWRPDGEFLPVAPYDDSAAVHGGTPKTMYEALVRIDAVAGGVFAEMKWSDGDKLVPTFARGIGYGSRPRSDIPRDADNLFLVMFHPRSEATHVRIDVGVGLDHAWEPLGALDGRVPYAPVTLPGAVIHPAREEEGRTVVTVSHQIVDRAVRLVAVDRHGFIRQPTKRSDGRRDDGGTYEATFGLPLAAIQEVRVEVQKLTWVAFKNVSLRPGQKTEVQIDTRSKGPIDAAAREVVLPEADPAIGGYRSGDGRVDPLPMQAGLRGIEQTIVY
jgi:beta-lactamase regulating signal transducer with metallopeptidase domain